MADSSFLSLSQLKTTGHQLIEQLLFQKPEHMHYNIAKANIYYWFNWFILNNSEMKHWWDGHHFSNMNRQQIIKVNAALRKITLTKILEQVQQHLNATYQNHIIPKTKKTKKGKEPATQVHRITEEEFYYKIIFHDILYGNEEGTTLLDTAESIKLQQHIDEYLKTLSTETTSIDLKLTMFTEVGLEAWLKQFFKNTQTLETITTFVRELLARAPIFQIPEETASSPEITATTVPLAAATEGYSQKAAPSPTASDKTKTHTKTTQSQQKYGPSTKEKQRQQEYKQQRQHISQAIKECFTDGALQWDKYTQVLAIYEYNQQLSNLCYELLREQQIAYNEQQYQQSKQQALQFLTQESSVHLAESIPAQDPSSSTASSSGSATSSETTSSAASSSGSDSDSGSTSSSETTSSAALSSGSTSSSETTSSAALSSSSATSSKTSASKQVIDGSQVASSSRSTRTKPQHHTSKESKQPQRTQPTIHRKTKILATTQINNQVMLEIKTNNLNEVQKYYNKYQFTTEFTQHAILLACQFNCPSIFEFLITLCPQAINNSISLLYNAITQKHNELFEKLLQHTTTKSQQDNNRLLELAIQKGNLRAVELLLTKYPAMLNQLFYNNSFSPLCAAICFGHTKIVELLLKFGADQNQTTSDNATPLFLAAQNGHTAIAKLLLQCGADPQQARINGITPFLIAARCGHTDIVKLLLSKTHVNINQSTSNGTTALFLAANFGHIGTVKLLLKNQAIVNLARNNGDTPIFIATAKGHTEIVKLLLKTKLQKIDINQPLANKMTILFIAASKGYIDIVNFLLVQPKINIELADQHAYTPLLIAAQHGHSEVVLSLLKHGANPSLVMNGGITPFLVATCNGHIKVVELLLQYNVDPNKAMADGITPLYIAAQKGHTKVVELLLQHNADPNKARNDGVTALLIAACNGHTKVVELLLQYNVDPNKAMADGITPLYIAAQIGHTEVVELLLQHNVDPNKARNDGITPLFIAAQNGHTKVVKLLLQHHVDPNKAINEDSTPLAIAINKGHFTIVKALLEGGAIADQIIHDNITPLLLAVNEGHIDMVTLLLSKSKESLNHANFYGTTPLYLAAKQGHTEIVKLLLAEQDIDINQATIKAITPIVIASQQGHSKIVKLLLEANAIITPEMANTIVAQFFQQVLSNKISSAEFAEILPLLLKKGAKIDHTNQHGNTYLMTATAFEKIELVTILLQHQADPTKVQITKDGVIIQRTAISIAEHKHNEAILSLLQAAATRMVTAISQTPSPSFTPALTSQESRTLAATSSQTSHQVASTSETETPTTTSQQASCSQEKPATTKTALT